MVSPGCSLARRGAHRSIAMAHCRSATRVLHWLLEVPRELSSTGQRQLHHHHHHHHHHFTGIDQPVPSSPSHLLSHWDAALGSWGPGRGMARARGLVPKLRFDHRATEETMDLTYFAPCNAAKVIRVSADGAVEQIGPRIPGECQIVPNNTH